MFLRRVETDSGFSRAHSRFVQFMFDKSDDEEEEEEIEEDSSREISRQQVEMSPEL